MGVLHLPCSADGRVLSVDGSLRIPTRGVLRHRISALLRRGERQIVLDLNGVSSIDAAGVGDLVRVRNLISAARGTLRIINTTARVRTVIERAGLGDILLADPVIEPGIDAHD